MQEKYVLKYLILRIVNRLFFDVIFDWTQPRECKIHYFINNVHTYYNNASENAVLFQCARQRAIRRSGVTVCSRRLPENDLLPLSFAYDIYFFFSSRS